MITNTVEMQRLKATMETTFLKKNCLPYMYARIMAQVVLLNV